MDQIQLLPDHIANQIAAGEVIQRPASAVKELLENAVDAGATSIQLIVNDAGKSLIQVIDNGKGMSETDARMAFERHATSKIKDINDLFRIRTMGFRGEALASIAAVAQTELKTKQAGEIIGTRLLIDSSRVELQEPCSTPEGTSIAMKNLFFNVPARRNFLKSNAAEMRHIVDEFIRVALAFSEIQFTLTANNQQLFYLEAGNLKQRIVQLLGNAINAKLVAVKEHTDYLNISGFIGKPETARKTRGDQYFFVNNRFIRSAYLNHAVTSAFENLLPADSFPLYVLFIELDPAQIDINVHPTKQEIKFEDEKIVYAFVQAAVKHALAQFSIAPSLDFTLNADIQQLNAVNNPFTEKDKEKTSTGNIYQSFTEKNQAHKLEHSNDLKDWKSFFDAPANPIQQTNTPTFEYASAKEAFQFIPPFLQLNQTYIIAGTNDGFLLVHQQLAHETILYQKYSTHIHQKQGTTQKILFPIPLDLSPADTAFLAEILPDLAYIGFEIEHVGNNNFVLQGTPADVLHGNEKNTIELLLEQLKHFSSEIKYSKREQLVRCMARQQAIKAGQVLSQQEMHNLVEELFTCNTPNTTPNGSPTYLSFNETYLSRMFFK
jgi:DNA mismatch repair protein MutL